MKYYSAPWSKTLWTISAVTTTVYLFLTCVAWRLFVARPDEMVRLLGLVPLASLIAAIFFMVRGYTVTPDAIVVHRLGWSTRLPRADIQSAEVRTDAMKNAFRLLANGGLFSFTGLYRSPALGNFRAFVTNDQNLVVVQCARRTVVLSPSQPDAFVEQLAMSCH